VTFGLKVCLARIRCILGTIYADNPNAAIQLLPIVGQFLTMPGRENCG